MAKILLSLLLLFSAPVFAQEYHGVDKKVKAYPYFSDLDVLAIRIKNDFDTDRERVRAAYTWLAYNIAYIKSLDNVFQVTDKVVYYSKYGKRKQVRRLLRKKMLLAFAARQGVCFEYSLLLEELCSRFGLRSEVIVGVIKSEIKDTKGKPQYKNHTWNAVNIDGEWKLLDPTWASVLVQMSGRRGKSKFLDHYFFTAPTEFVKHHLPSNPDWQLLEQPVDAHHFFKAPIYLPEYFGKGIALSSKTLGIIPLSGQNEHLLYFDEVPSKQAMYYNIEGTRAFRRLQLQKYGDSQYFSKIKLNRRSRGTDYVTIYLEKNPILNFKIEK